MGYKRPYSFLTKDLTPKQPERPIEGRNIFKIAKTSLADSYDYKIDVFYPSNHARISFSKIVPNKNLHKNIPVRTSDFVPTPRSQISPGSNVLVCLD